MGHMKSSTPALDGRAWMDEVKRAAVPAIGEALGLQARGRRAYGPCPVCGATSRGSNDRRGPLGYQGAAWRCWASGCDARGSTLDLIAAVELGRRPQGREDWRRVHARAYAIGATATAPEGDTPPAPPRRLPAAPAAPERHYPALREVADLWTFGAVPVHELPEGRRWLEALLPGGCGVCPPHLARIIPTPEQARARWGLRYGPARSRLPRWARWGALPWHAAGYRILLPMYDACGRLRSLRARHHDLPAPGAPKAVSPAGCRVSGLVFANQLGVEMLRGQASPALVLLTEGGTDTLAASLLSPPHVPRAILGVGSGAWTADHADQIPPGAEVVIATDPDEAGERYAQQIVASLPDYPHPLRVRRANLSADVRSTLARGVRRG